MNVTTVPLYQLALTNPASQLADVLGTKIGKYTLNLKLPVQPEKLEVFDCFDQSIRKSNRILYRSDDHLVLIDQHCTLLTQLQKNPINFVSALDDGPIKTALADVPALRTLLPSAHGAILTGRGKFLDNHAKTVARLSIQGIAEDEKDNWHLFLTVAPVRGYNKALKVITTSLNANKHLLQNRSLTPERFYLALNTKPTSYNPKPAMSFADNPCAQSVANQIISTFIGVARANEPGVIADYDTEFLHDYRVSLRKVRSVLSLFKGIYSGQQTEQLKQTFAELMNSTSRLRDLDVYLLEKESFYLLLPDSLHPGLDIMFNQFEQQRARQHKQLSKNFACAAYKEKISQLATLFSESEQDISKLQPGPQASRPATEYARELIWNRYHKVCKIARVIDADTPDEQIHELRIHCKKLRYLMEFFEPLFATKKIKRLIKSLKLLQENLGLFNDYSVQQKSLQSYLATHAGKDRDQDIAVAQSVGALISILNQKQHQEHDKIVANLSVLDSNEICQNFRLLFTQKTY